MGVAHDDQDLQNDQSADRTQYVMTFPWSANFEPLGLGSILVLSRNMFVYTFLKLFSQFDSNYNLATGLPVDSCASISWKDNQQWSFFEDVLFFRIVPDILYTAMFLPSLGELKCCIYQALEVNRIEPFLFRTREGF